MWIAYGSQNQKTVATNNMKNNKLHIILDYSGLKPWIWTSLDIALDKIEFRHLG